MTTWEPTGPLPPKVAPRPVQPPSVGRILGRALLAGAGAGIVCGAVGGALLGAVDAALIGAWIGFWVGLVFGLINVPFLVNARNERVSRNGVRLVAASISGVGAATLLLAEAAITVLGDAHGGHAWRSLLVFTALAAGAVVGGYVLYGPKPRR